MKKWLLPTVLTASLITLGACSGDSEAVVETKSGNITKDELYTALKEANGEQVLQNLVYEKVLSEKYKVTDKELDKRVEEIKAELGDNFEMALAQYGYEDEDDFKEQMKLPLMQEKAAIKVIKVTEEEMKEYYENIKPEIHARHILVEDEKTAKDLKAKIDAGESFEELAKQDSTDEGSKESGGDLGWFGSGRMVAEFEEAAYALEVGKVSEPVQSEYGYHIIEVLEKKEKKSYEDMKEEIEYEVKVSKIDSETIQKVMEEELKNADVKVKDKELKDAIATDSSETAES